jgi:hypothetical protein
VVLEHRVLLPENQVEDRCGYGLWGPLGTIENLFHDAKHGAALRGEGVFNAPVPIRWLVVERRDCCNNRSGPAPVLPRVGPGMCRRSIVPCRGGAGLGGVYAVPGRSSIPSTPVLIGSG